MSTENYNPAAEILAWNQWQGMHASTVATGS
jgi:hypothetical protein